MYGLKAYPSRIPLKNYNFNDEMSKIIKDNLNNLSFITEISDIVTFHRRHMQKYLSDNNISVFIYPEWNMIKDLSDIYMSSDDVESYLINHIKENSDLLIRYNYIETLTCKLEGYLTKFTYFLVLYYDNTTESYIHIDCSNLSLSNAKYCYYFYLDQILRILYYSPKYNNNKSAFINDLYDHYMFEETVFFEKYYSSDLISHSYILMFMLQLLIQKEKDP